MLPPPLRRVVLCSATVLFAAGAAAQGPVRTPQVHALTGARVIVAPGQVIEDATIVIRDGLIESVGADVAVPADARVHELDSLWVYPGLIDAAMVVAPPEAEEDDAVSTLEHDLSVVRPQMNIADAMALKDSDLEARRAAGITTARVIPKGATFRGRAAVLNLGDGGLGANLLVREAGQVVSFQGAGSGYPSSTMGVVAVLRQAFADARWYADAQVAYRADPRGTRRPEVNAAWAALEPAMNGEEPILFLADDMLDVLRADGIAKEFDLVFHYVGSGEEYKRLDAVAAAVPDLVVPVAFPKAPAVSGETGADLAVTTETLRHWDNAPGNPGAVYRSGTPMALTAEGLKDVGAFREKVAEAIGAGLPRDAALAACTTVPAELLGLQDQVGTVERGMIANLVVTDGELFADSTRVLTVWIDGEDYEVEALEPPEGDPRGTWEYVASAQGQEYPGKLIIGGEPGALTAIVVSMGTESEADITHSGDRLRIEWTSDAIGALSLDLTFQGDSGQGSGTSAYGGFSVTMTRTAAHDSTPGGSR